MTCSHWRLLMSFNVFLKKFDILSQCLIPSITKKKSFLTCWFWEHNHLQPFKYKIFIKLFQGILKSIKTFLIQNDFCSNAQKRRIKTKKPRQILIWRQIPKLKNKKDLINFKIRVSQLITKISLKQQSLNNLNKIRHRLAGHN